MSMQFRAGQFRDAACGLACDIRATPQAAKASRLAVLSLAIALGIAPLLLAQAPDKFPSAAEVTELLKKEPVSATTWPAWRERLLAWITDPGDGTNPAFDAARKFMRSQAGGKGTLPAEFAQDHLAWYLLGNELLFEHQEEADLREETRQAEAAQRRSIELDPKFAAAHRNLACCLLREEEIDRALGTEK